MHRHLVEFANQCRVGEPGLYGGFCLAAMQYRQTDTCTSQEIVAVGKYTSDLYRNIHLPH